jgi:hypothetical protein
MTYIFLRVTFFLPVCTSHMFILKTLYLEHYHTYTWTSKRFAKVKNVEE